MGIETLAASSVLGASCCMSRRNFPWRKMAGRRSLVTSMVGMTIVLTSMIFFFVDDGTQRVLGVTAGLFFLLLSIYYAVRPFLTDERSYLDLRREIDLLHDLMRELHYASIRGDDAAFESIKKRVPALVEMLIETARNSEAPRPPRG